jgi:hypothetical protein
MDPQQRCFLLADLRSAIERLASPSPRQVEWICQRDVHPEDLVTDAIHLVRTTFDKLGSEFSPLLVGRLLALVDQLNAILGEPEAMVEAPGAILQHSSWTLVRHSAEAALRTPGWPSA